MSGVPGVEKDPETPLSGVTQTQGCTVDLKTGRGQVVWGQGPRTVPAVGRGAASEVPAGSTSPDCLDWTQGQGLLLSREAPTEPSPRP